MAWKLCLNVILTVSVATTIADNLGWGVVRVDEMDPGCTAEVTYNYNNNIRSSYSKVLDLSPLKNRT